MTKAYSVAACIAAVSSVVVSAFSPTNAEAQTASPAIDWSVEIGAATEYVGKGLGKSDGDPSIFAGVQATHGGFYGKVWASSADLPQGINAEIITSLGYKTRWAGNGVNIVVMNRELTGAPDTLDRIGGQAGFRQNDLTAIVFDRAFQSVDLFFNARNPRHHFAQLADVFAEAAVVNLDALQIVGVLDADVGAGVAFLLIHRALDLHQLLKHRFAPGDILRGALDAGELPEHYRAQCDDGGDHQREGRGQLMRDLEIVQVHGNCLSEGFRAGSPPGLGFQKEAVRAATRRPS